METGIAPERLAASLATALPERTQRRAAWVLSVLAVVATLCLLPLASLPGPVLPGFVLINQTALVAAYSLSAWTLFAQFRRARSLPLLLIAGGTLYTAAIVLLQLLSFPGVIANGRLLGAGPETTTWLWTFWHLGPPGCALAYAAAMRRGGAPRFPAEGCWRCCCADRPAGAGHGRGGGAALDGRVALAAAPGDGG